jgi:hypothetical protein
LSSQSLSIFMQRDKDRKVDKEGPLAYI